MKTLIRNNTQSPIALPLPYTGILSAGEGVVVDETTKEVAAALFDEQKTSLTNIYNVSEVSDRTKSSHHTRTDAARKIGMALAKAPVDLEVNGVRLRRVGNPTSTDDAATKGYVDSIQESLQSLFAVAPQYHFGERYFEIGDASTGIWYVTISARAATTALLDELAAIKHITSTTGGLGTFAIDIEVPAGVAVQSVTVFTYTKKETQPRVVLTMDNPQGARHAHRFVRPSVLQFPPTNTPTSTVSVSVADASGATPTTYGVVGQLDPTSTYPKIRIVATGFFAANNNSVSDHNFNKPQSLVVQF